MKISLRRVNEAVHFQATNEDGLTVDIDGAPKIGGVGAGYRPMQLALTALAGCATMDVVSILQKQRQDLVDITIDISGERREGSPSPFKQVHIHYDLYGTIDSDKAARAIELAVYKYCSVGEMIKSTTEITTSFDIHPASATEARA
jgi:putative redox protein